MNGTDLAVTDDEADRLLGALATDKASLFCVGYQVESDCAAGRKG
jgi:hypothetical protein